jgi:HAD superfamily hydrolase (TIGR01549 family)
MMPKTKYELVIFDMDGTLTEELLDFETIRRDIGVPTERMGILEHIATLGAEEKRKAEEILHRHELAAADCCGAHMGAAEMLQGLRDLGIKTALLTRNSAASAERILSRNALALDYVATRDNRPHKPHPDSILNITGAMGISPRQTLMVGDYLYDLQAAQAAGTDSALIRVEGDRPEFATMATYCIRELREILTLVVGE